MAAWVVQRLIQLDVGGPFRIGTPTNLKTPQRPNMDSIHDWIPDPVQPYYHPESVTEAASLMSRYMDNDIPGTNFTSAPAPFAAVQHPVQAAWL